MNGMHRTSYSQHATSIYIMLLKMPRVRRQKHSRKWWAHAPLVASPRVSRSVAFPPPTQARTQDGRSRSTARNGSYDPRVHHRPRKSCTPSCTQSTLIPGPARRLTTLRALSSASAADSSRNCWFSSVKRSFSRASCCTAAMSLRGSIKHSLLCCASKPTSSRAPHPQGQSCCCRRHSHAFMCLRKCETSHSLSGSNHTYYSRGQLFFTEL